MFWLNSIIVSVNILHGWNCYHQTYLHFIIIWYWLFLKFSGLVLLLQFCSLFSCYCHVLLPLKLFLYLTYCCLLYSTTLTPYYFIYFFLCYSACYWLKINFLLYTMLRVVQSPSYPLLLVLICCEYGELWLANQLAIGESNLIAN